MRNDYFTIPGQFVRAFSRRFLPGLLCLLLAACLESGAVSPQIVDFQATPDRFPAGSDAEVLLSWNIANPGETRASLSALPVGEDEYSVLVEDLGTQQRFLVRPSGTTIYRLTVNGPRGVSHKEVTVWETENGEEEPSPTIASFEADRATVDPGGEVRLTWNVTGADSLVLTSNRGLTADVSGEDEHLIVLHRSTTFTLTASNAWGSSSRSLVVQVEGDSANRILVLIAGQSNAAGEGTPFPEGREVAEDGVFMLVETSSGYQWAPAEEPLHTYPSPRKHSFGVRMANELKRATGLDVYLVPTAIGGSSIAEWLPSHSSGYFDRATEMTRFAADDLGVPVAAIAWFQGETDSKDSSRRDSYVEDTLDVFEAFRSELPGPPPILYAQLSKRLEDSGEPSRNLAYQVIREQQRMMQGGAIQSGVLEPGGSPRASSIARSYLHMVVSHDLPMSDIRHLSRDGQKVLGSRFAHAFLVHAWSGEGARGPERAGPRLEGIELEGPDGIRIRLSRPVNPGTGYGGYFAVFVDGERIDIASASHHPDDPSSVLVRVVGELPDDPSRIHVRYMPPDDAALHSTSTAVIHSEDESGLVLPLPAFGLPVEPFQSNFLQLY